MNATTHQTTTRPPACPTCGQPPPFTLKPWHMTTYTTLSFVDCLRILFGARVYAQFSTPDGRCHAGAHLSLRVLTDWPADNSAAWKD